MVSFQKEYKIAKMSANVFRKQLADVTRKFVNVFERVHFLGNGNINNIH